MSVLARLLAEASSLAAQVDALFWAMVALCGTAALAVFVVVIFFAVRYRRGSKADRSGAHDQSTGIEVFWTLIPLALFMGVFTWSLFVFAHLSTPPQNSQTIYVDAKQWMWKIQHPSGQREINTLHVPLDTPIRLTMTSEDVIHSFYVPAFRVKQDVLPGRYTQLWFKATKLGEFPLECAEYCGLDHARMGGNIVVMRPADFTKWLNAHPGPTSLAAAGAALFRARGCSGCHGPQAIAHAPPLAGLYGQPVQLSNGAGVIADESYLRDSILLPNKQIVAGYAPIMPSYAGQMSEEELSALIDYMKSMRPDGGPAANLESPLEHN